ncbi:MAG: branched-chain amino acid ABC transporter permease [Kiloniellales bacterium]
MIRRLVPLAVVPALLVPILFAGAALAATDGAANPPLPASAGWETSALYLLQQCINAIVVGTFYGLLAVAYVLIYGITNRINLSFGAFAMWAGCSFVLGALVVSLMLPYGLAVTLLAALAYALANTVLLGVVLQRGVVRRLVRVDSLAMLVATIGLAIVLEEIMRIANSGRERWLSPVLSEPILLVRSSLFAIQVTAMQLLVVGGATLLALALIVFMARHRFGRLWRACSQDLRMAELCGIDTDRVLLGAFALSSAYAAGSGVLIGLYYGNVNFYMGTVLGLKTLLAAVIGGLTSVTGAFAGALLLGFLESLWSAYFSAEYRDVAVFGIMACLMILKPDGLLAPSRRNLLQP